MLTSKTMSTIHALAAILAALVLHVVMVQPQLTNQRRGVKLECLDKTPSDQCNLVVTYGSPVGTLQCDQKVPESDGIALGDPPQLGVPPDTQEITNGALVMFDPDAPVSDQATEGFVHWIAAATVDKTGRLTIGQHYIEYYPPTPPRGGGEHRYQFFLYKMDGGKSLNYTTARKFSLCPFVKQNNLAQPVSAFQFRFERAST